MLVPLSRELISELGPTLADTYNERVSLEDLLSLESPGIDPPGPVFENLQD